MTKSKSICLQDHFEELSDPRRGPVTYPLLNVVVIAVCAILCGADDFVSIAEFGVTKRNWLAKFLDLSAGIPSHDRFNAILVFDEIQCGVGRSGAHFAYQLLDPQVTPDVTVSDKPMGCGIPIGFVAATERAAAAIGSIGK